MPLNIPEKPWAASVEEVARALEVSPNSGLSQKEARRRLKEFGPNSLREAKKQPVWKVFLNQFENPIVALLGVASFLGFAFGQWLEGVAVLAAIGVNLLVGFFTELKAVRSMEALSKMGQAVTRVKRGGEVMEIPAGGVVPGDLVVIEAGDVVPADLRIVEASNIMMADESALTGESVPADKGIGPVAEDASIGERTSMLFKGCGLTRGSGHGVATATGMQTEIGRIQKLVEEAGEEQSPLEKRLEVLSRKLIWITLAIAVAMAILGLATGQDMFQIIETSIALAVAAIPEGLPVVATIALARGMFRMARRNALVTSLSAVETLGATQAVFTDKTGTLTENRMELTRAALQGSDGTEEVDLQDGALAKALEGEHGEVLRAMVEVGVLCVNANLGRDGDEEAKDLGDPLEIALLRAGRRAGIRRRDLLQRLPEVKEVAFDPETMMMATVHEQEEGFLVAVKGAPGAVLRKCSSVAGGDGQRPFGEEELAEYLKANDSLARKGLRVLGMARKEVADRDAEPYEGLTLLGLAGLLDPPREDVAESIRKLRDAGVRVVMVTGDQKVTAEIIGQAVGLSGEGAEAIEGRAIEGLTPQDLGPERTLFARVSPEQKLRLIELYQKQGMVVAMTGDGVNDAPALKKADIGVAMGKRGTQVAREASDIVLKDDSFTTIVAAVEQGRVIFSNIRKFIVYLFSGNVGEILIVAAAMILGAPLPLLPLQILYLNMLGDVFPALALGVGPGDPGVMRLPPRPPDEPMVTRGMWLLITCYSAMLGVLVLSAFFIALHVLGMETPRAVTVAFLSLAFSRLVHTLNMREPGSSLILNDVTRNRWIWGALAVCAALLVLALKAPILSRALGLAAPGLQGWALIAGAAALTLPLGQLVRAVWGKRLVVAER